ncbi:hypothetical protein RJ640_013956 [Escallonia rubra]|uniref:Heat shock protein 70 n=1 Tax=Escallonia rubra TaxID=112253 RepID=A0AA88R7B9_9ASTE|nr:hypothetical protein RJ640_013956 [Escallonia rubra]
MEGGKPVIITNAEGQRSTPSVVAWTKNGDRLLDPKKINTVVGTIMLYKPITSKMSKKLSFPSYLSISAPLTNRSDVNMR